MVRRVLPSNVFQDLKTKYLQMFRGTNMLQILNRNMLRFYNIATKDIVNKKIATQKCLQTEEEKEQ